MSAVKKCKVMVKRDYLFQIASGSPESALSEMIWNALDADSTKVDVRFHEGPLGIDEITISDNGTGIPYYQAENLFAALGGSWKASQEKTTEGRLIHGKDGKGRFKAFVLGRVVEWDVVYKENDNLKGYKIEGISDALDEFSITGEELSVRKNTGVNVRITEIIKRFHLFDRDKAIEKLTPMLALYLRNYPFVTVRIEGNEISPKEIIQNSKVYPLKSIAENGLEHPVELEIVEWNKRNGGIRHFFPHLFEGQTSLPVQYPKFSLVTSTFGIQRFKSAAALLVDPYPALDGSSADTGSVGMGNIPFVLALLPKQLRLFAIVQLRTVYKILNDAKSEYGYINFLLLFHKSPLVLGLQVEFGV